MWSALRSDLKEFATSIASDGHAIRDKIETNLVHPNDSDSQGDDASLSQGVDDMIIGENGEVAYLAGDHDDFRTVKDPLYEATREAQRRAELEETFLVPLLVHEVNGSKKSLSKKSSLDVADSSKTEECNDERNFQQDEQRMKSEDGKSSTTAPNATGNDESEIQQLSEENEEDGKTLQDCVDDDESYDEDDMDVLEFLNSFHIESKTDEIGEILAQYPDSVGFHFETLVPVTITYEQFWQRYYYRCDPERIQREWDQERERIKQERQEFIDKGKKTVQNIFGGALKVIKGATSHDNQEIGSGSESIYEKYQAELEEKRKALQEVSSRSGHDTKQEHDSNNRGGIGAFGGLFTSVRPPFVMNTAVDDDEDNDDEYASSSNVDGNDDINHNQEEDEEDFGWGSDDDEGSDVDEEEQLADDDDDVTEGTEEVVFSSNNLPNNDDVEPRTIERLKKELSDALCKNKELERMVKEQQDQLSMRNANDNNEDASMDYEKLRLELFEKDSELAAVKASLEEISEHKVNELESELKQLRAELHKKELELEKCHNSMREADAIQDEEDAKDSEMLTEALDTITALQSELETSKLEASQELVNMKKEYERQVAEMKNELQNVQDSLLQSRQAMGSLQTELDVTDDELSQLKTQYVELQESSRKDLACALDKVASLEIELNNSKTKIDDAKTEASEEMQTLKQNLAQIESAYAALQSEFQKAKEESATLQKSTIEINDDERGTALKDALEIVSRLNLELDEKNKECLKLQNDIVIYRETYVNEQNEKSRALDEAHDTIENLKKKLDESNTLCTQKLHEMATQLESSKVNSDDTRVKFEQQVAQLLSKIQLLENEKKTYENDLIGLKQRLERQPSEENKQSEMNSLSLSSPNEGSSFSSGVDVQQPSTHSEAIGDCNGGGDDDGWGDDWSDDEDNS